MIIIEDMHRRTNWVPYMSEVSLAINEADQLIDSLRHVIITNVVHEGTLEVLGGEIYRNMEFSDDWWRT